MLAVVEGLSVYAINDVYNPEERQTIPGYDFIDLISYNDLLICRVSDGICYTI